MIHYHGTPISPRAVLYDMAGRNFCVSFADPRDLEVCHQIGQSVMLDNGAFSFWKDTHKNPDPAWWDDYAAWAEPWLDFHTTWAVLPDVIDGTERDNDDLLYRFLPLAETQGAPVWHMHESLDRLDGLASAYRRVCIGSSGAYADTRSPQWTHRMDAAFNRLCPTGGKTPVPIHMLRAMERACSGDWPFASADSTNVAQNHAAHPSRDKAAVSPARIAARADARQAPARWTVREQLAMATDG